LSTQTAQPTQTQTKLKRRKLKKVNTLPIQSKTALKQQRIKAFLSKYSIQFDMDEAAIDLRTMAENYQDGIIPSLDITESVNAVLGLPPIARGSVDPRNSLNFPIPQFAWVPIDDVAIDPRFQRDIIPNHVTKIENDFQSDMIIIPCAVKDPNTGKYLLWDGNHTRQVCERMGWSYIPVWYTEIDVRNNISQQDAIKALILHAGKSFLTINKKNKRAVSRYDEHMISVECGDADAVAIQNIVNSTNCQINRAGTNGGDITHIDHLYEAYNLVDHNNIKGRYLKRSLDFYRKTWPQEKICVIMLGMARLYYLTEIQMGALPSPQFDTDLGNILKKIYGPADICHDESTGFKSQFISHFGSLGAHPPVVTSGLILTANKHLTGYKLAQPESNYPVK